MSSSSDEGQSLNDFEVDNSQEMLEDDLIDGEIEDKWVFPNPRKYLGTVLNSGVVRPLSPTLKEHSLESVFPGVAMLYEGFDNMREWKNTIEFVGYHAQQGKKKNLFNSRHHWDMRTKFLEVRLRCMDKIVEDPFPQRQPEGLFFLRVPIAVKKAVDNKKRETAPACEVDNVKKMYKDSAVELNKFEKNELSVDTGSIKGQHCAQQEVRNVVERKKNIGIEKSIDEKLHRKSLQKELNVESRQAPEMLNSLSGTSVQYQKHSKGTLPETSAAGDCGHFNTSNDSDVDSFQDLLVIGNAIANPNLSRGGDVETEKESNSKCDELVLEDINEKDVIPDVIFPSSCKLGPMSEDEYSEHRAAMTTQSTNEVCGKQERTLSRFQRLRKRMRTWFSCFGNNKVTPVDI